jgi:hypothetical protein
VNPPGTTTAGAVSHCAVGRKRPRRGVRAAANAVSFVLAFLGACGVEDVVVAIEARRALIGLAADDLRLCAGIPDRSATFPSGEFWTYVRSTPAGGVNLTLPGPFAGGVNLSAAGDCRVTFQLVDGRVRRIGYSGASEFDSGASSTCAPIVHGCLSALRTGEIGPVVATAPPAAAGVPPAVAPTTDGGVAGPQAVEPAGPPPPGGPAELHRTRP